jgi:hypothetical protein
LLTISVALLEQADPAFSGTSSMSVMRAALLSFMMFSAILLSGAGIYSAGAVGGYGAIDGYGISAPH